VKSALFGSAFFTHANVRVVSAMAANATHAVMIFLFIERGKKSNQDDKRREGYVDVQCDQNDGKQSASSRSYKYFFRL